MNLFDQTNESGSGDQTSTLQTRYQQLVQKTQTTGLNRAEYEELKRIRTQFN